MKFRLFHNHKKQQAKAQISKARRQTKAEAKQKAQRKYELDHPKVGTKTFDHYIFNLTEPLTGMMIKRLEYHGHELHPDGFNNYVMPAYTSRTLNMYIIVTIIKGWSKYPMIAFCRGNKNAKGEINLEPPMETGRGLNLIGTQDSNAANDLLQYFRTLQDTKHGHFTRLEIK